MTPVLIYFLTVFPVGLALLYLAAWYDHTHVPTVDLGSLPAFTAFKDLKQLWKDLTEDAQ